MSLVFYKATRFPKNSMQSIFNIYSNIVKISWLNVLIAFLILHLGCDLLRTDAGHLVVHKSLEETVPWGWIALKYEQKSENRMKEDVALHWVDFQQLAPAMPDHLLQIQMR